MTGAFELTIGATPLEGGRARFRVWAPDRGRVDVCIERPGRQLAFLPLERVAGGYFEAVIPAEAGDRYRYRLDGGDCFPDPASRFQPEGPHGPSQLIDPRAYAWKDSRWRGPSGGIRGQVIYELHVGAFTPEGTYAAAARELPRLKDLGVTALELMPLHCFPGRFNWGYDGVTLFSPPPPYGTPDELKALVDACHQLGLSVLLDVVFNHLGPDGNYLSQYAKGYFVRDGRYPKEWGEPPDFESEHSQPVRDFFIENACYWLSEYHFDGLRVDATQSLYDASELKFPHELATRARAAVSRPVLLIAESEPQDLRYVAPPEEGGFGYDALWVDDFHHTCRVAAVGKAEAYLQDYRGTSQELLSALLRNSLFQGQYFRWQKKPRGSPLLRTPSERVVFYLQNHDQIANSLRGQRLHQLASESVARALTTLLLLAPQTPLLFMGQEYFASTPFLFFVDHVPELMQAIEKGRTDFIAQFPSVRQAISEGGAPPIDARAFALSRLVPAELERPEHQRALLLHRDLLELRRGDPTFASQDRSRLAGATLGERALVARYFGASPREDRLLLLNLGADLELTSCAEPLLAPSPGTRWSCLFSSEATRYGGGGCQAPTGEGTWIIPGSCAVVLAPEPS